MIYVIFPVELSFAPPASSLLSFMLQINVLFSACSPRRLCIALYPLLMSIKPFCYGVLFFPPLCGCMSFFFVGVSPPFGIGVVSFAIVLSPFGGDFITMLSVLSFPFVALLLVTFSTWLHASRAAPPFLEKFRGPRKSITAFGAASWFV
ncbi:MAG: hypothetical protein PHT95_03345 [Candidatus Omnitrophica bacterium]|jgi:hypothetical protein|nr:hypothetical protein [Candidatus Omnitrophota bacterium]